MTKTLIKPRLHFNKPKIKQEPNNTKSNLPPNLQSFKQKYYLEMVLLYLNELRRLPIIR